MTSSCKIINGVPTQVITFGIGIEEESKMVENVRHLVLIIPGNPGVIGYYETFMKELYEILKEKFPNQMIPVWGIGHAGHHVHGLDETSFSFPDHHETPELYDLDGQVQHKLEFIRNSVPAHVNIIGGGHSIGCKIWIEILKKDLTSDPQQEQTKHIPNISKCFMLFPTIERMQQTRNGQFFSKVFPYRRIIKTVLWPIFVLPERIKRGLLTLLFLGRSPPPCVKDATLQLFHPDVFHRVLEMAVSELEQVVDLDTEVIVANMEKLWFYFGRTDWWSPLHYVEEMLLEVPGLRDRVRICDKGLEHAFVVAGSEEMATILGNLITLEN